MSNPEEQQAIGEILKGIGRPVIVELGAHVGEEYQWLSTYNPSRYVMVEPDELNCQQIRGRFHPPMVRSDFTRRLMSRRTIAHLVLRISRPDTFHISRKWNFRKSKPFKA
jgi:hypothetical protein